MAKSSKLRVMLSSRCKDLFSEKEPTKLSVIRQQLKTEIEAMDIAGRKAFEVWINEETDPQGGKWDSWEVCMNAVKDCDILIVISNGNAGWAGDDVGSGGIGICHAEMMTGLSIAPAKVHLIELKKIPITNDDEGRRNNRFQDYLSKQDLFRGGEIKTIDDLKKCVKSTLAEAVIKLTQAGVTDAAKGKFHSGEALDWSRLDFGKRQKEMVRVVRETMLARKGSAEELGKVFVEINKQLVLVEPHAIPAALTIGPAKELVGQPFLRDYLLAPNLKNRGGPVHLIACHKTATESQALKLLGFPNATFVTAPFGVFVADPVQKVQFAFITNCRDEFNTRHGVQRFMKWLDQTGEDKLLAERAQARSRIITAIAKENAP